MNKTQRFEIISFTADARSYYPASMERAAWMGDDDVKHTDIDIPLGRSRYGGPVIDFPEAIEHPEGMRFAAQLDLAQFATHDSTGLLPMKGQILVFADIVRGAGLVFYTDVPNRSLVRTIVEHEDHFFSGLLIDSIYRDTETVAERFRAPEEDEGEQDVDEDGQIWDYFAGSNRSKLLGLYTNCQCHQNEIEEVLNSGRVPLLQIGENGFNDAGVFSVLIHKDDLRNREFGNCQFVWAQP